MRRILMLAVVAAAMVFSGHGAQAESIQTDRVKAHTTDVYSGVYFGTGPCWVEVIGDGDTDLDLFVYDEDNNMSLLRQDTGPTDRCKVTFNAAGPGTCTIKIQNLGSVYNNYRLRVSQ